MLFLSKIKQTGRVALGVLGLLFILEGIRDGWRSYSQQAEAITLTPSTGDNALIMGEGGLIKLEERRRLFASYILSRVEKTTFGIDAAGLYVQALAEYLAVPLEIRAAKQELNKGFPPTLARAVEEMLTGDVWTEAMEGPAARPLG